MKEKIPPTSDTTLGEIIQYRLGSPILDMIKEGASEHTLGELNRRVQR